MVAYLHIYKVLSILPCIYILKLTSCGNKILANIKCVTDFRHDDGDIDATSEYLHKLLNCQFNDVPTEFIIHYFHGFFHRYQTSVHPFIRCINEKKVLGKHGECRKSLGSNCPVRFGKNQMKMKVCKRALWDETHKKPRVHVSGEKFRNYSSCMSQARDDATACVDKLTAMCQGSDFRTIKTVRATMASVENMIEMNENFRMIHLVRDPRAVVLSRQKFHSSGRSLYAGEDVVREAKLFCQNLAHDILLRQNIERRYPGTTLEILYDEFVRDPLNQTEKIYNFMNVTLGQKVRTFIVENTKQKVNSTAIVDKWQDTLTYLKVKTINSVCRKVFLLIDTKHDWG